MTNPSPLIGPSDFQAFPEAEELFTRIPPETQVTIVAENHIDLFHRLWIEKRLIHRLAAENDILAIEDAKGLEESYQRILKVGGRPVDWRTDDPLPGVPVRSTDPRAKNPLQHVECVAGYYGILATANFKGMKMGCVDHPGVIDDAYARSAKGMAERNLFIADEIASFVHQGMKVFYWAGDGHVYNGCVHGWNVPSVQQLLQEKGKSGRKIIVYSCALLSGYEGFLRYYNELKSQTRDEKAAAALAEFRRELPKRQLTRPVTVDLHDYTSQAGSAFPDLNIVFSERGRDWWVNARRFENTDYNQAAETACREAILAAHGSPRPRLT